MNCVRKSYFYIIFLSVFLILSAVSCGDGVQDGGGEQKVTVRLKMDGLFEEESRNKRTSIGGQEASTLYLDISASGWSGLRLNLSDMLEKSEREVDVEITAGKIYTFTVSAYTSGGVLLCSGSESAMIQAAAEVKINLVCALQISVDLSPAKVEGVMNLLEYQSLPSVQTAMSSLSDAVADGVNLGEVQDAVEEAELAAGSASKSKNSQSYRMLVEALRNLKLSSPSAFNAFKNMVNALDNTAELKEAAELLESVLEEGLKPEISVNPSSVSFGNVETGTLSDHEIVMITNSGNFRLGVESITLSDNYNFILHQAGSSPCASAPFVLLPGESCTVSVAASPYSVGALSSLLTVSSDNSSVDDGEAALSVNGIAPPVTDVSISPTSADFGSVEIGESETVTLTVNNTGTNDLKIEYVSVNPPQGVYTTDASSCANPVPAGSSCGITVTFEPLAAMSYTASVSIEGNFPLSPKVISASGIGVPAGSPVITPDRTKLDFGAVLNPGLVTKTIVLTNTGSAEASGISAVITGAADFTESENCSTLAPGDNCTVTVTFEPDMPTGERSAMLEVSSNAPSVSIGLKGYSVEEGTRAKTVLFEDTTLAALSERNVAMCGGGRAHAAFTNGSKVAYAFFDGGEWYLSDIGVQHDASIGGVAIAADSDCMPHIAYTMDNGTGFELYYAQSRVSGFWEHKKVSGTDASSMSETVSIAADGADIYISSIIEGTYDAVVDKTSDFGAAFTRKNIATGLAGPESTLLKIDQTGTVHMVFRDSDGIHYANNTSDPWPVDEEIANGYFPSIAFYGTEVHVIYHDGGLYETVNSGGGWSSTPAAIDGAVNGSLAAVTRTGEIRVFYKYNDSATPKIMTSTYTGTWSAPAEFYDNSIAFFTGSSMLAAASGPSDSLMVVYDEGAVLVSKSYAGALWSASSEISPIVGVNENISFDMEFDSSGNQLVGAVADLVYEQSGGLYIFNSSNGSFTVEALDTPEKYTVKGLDLFLSEPDISICYIYSTDGITDKIGYLDRLTYGSHNMLDTSTSPVCSVAADGNGDIFIAYGDSTGKPTLREIGGGITGGLTSQITESSISMKYLPSENKLYLSYYDNTTANEHYGLNFFSNAADKAVETAAHVNGFTDLAVSASGSLIYLLGGTDSAYDSIVAVAECDPDLSSCLSQEPFYPAAGNNISGVSLAVDSSDHVYAAVIEEGRGIILADGILNDTYDETILDNASAYSTSYNGIKTLINPATQLVSVFYRSGGRLVHETESLIPVPAVSHIYKNFGKVSIGSFSSELVITVANTGTQVMNVGSIALQHGDDFVLEKDYGAGSCQQNSFLLYPSESCTVKVRFNPSAGGALSDRMILETDGGKKTTNVFGVGI
ncbi:MAG: choice-of-anchor D domain-containing protein [Deferribacterales bacterium]